MRCPLHALLKLAVFVPLVTGGCREDLGHRMILGVVTGLEGKLAPRGCDTDPTGGLAKLASAIESQQHDLPHFAWVALGNTFFGAANSAPKLRGQHEASADTLGQILGKLKPQVIVPGPFDMSPAHFANTFELARRHGLPMFERPRTIRVSASRVDGKLLSLGGLRIGLMGIPGDASGEAASLSRKAAAMRAQDVDLIIALVPVGGSVARSVAGRLDGVDVVIGGGERKSHATRMQNGVLLVEAGVQARMLGLLEFIPRPSESDDGSTWHFDDRGDGARRALRQQIEVLETTLERFPLGDARKQREAKLEGLQRELAELEPETPDGSLIRYTAVPLDASAPASKWATEKISAHDRALCDIGRRATDELKCPEPATRAQRYAGDATCRDCHTAAFTVYGQTAHANAWKSLVEAGRQCDLTCIGCHTTGYDAAGGFCRLADADGRGNVGCESCHGPRAGHARNVANRRSRIGNFPNAVTPEACATCHTAEHSSDFEFERALSQQVGVGHGWDYVPQPPQQGPEPGQQGGSAAGDLGHVGTSAPPSPQHGVAKKASKPPPSKRRRTGKPKPPRKPRPAAKAHAAPQNRKRSKSSRRK